MKQRRQRAAAHPLPDRTRQGEHWAVPGTDALVPVTRWEEPADPYAGKASQDAAAVIAFERPRWAPQAQAVLRIVVADGVTPNATTPSIDGLDGAAWAARTAVDAFRTSADLKSAANVANRRIDAGTRAAATAAGIRPLPLHDRPRTMLAAIDIHIAPNGTWRAHLANAGDCDIRVHDGGTWAQPITEMGYAAGPMQRSEAYYRANPHLPKEDLVAYDDALFSTPEAFDSTPLGAFPPSVPLKLSFHGIQGRGPLQGWTFVATTDGIRAEEIVDFDFDRTRERLEQLADPMVASEGLYLKRRDDKATVAVGSRVNLLPDGLALPEPGRFVVDSGTGPTIREGSSFSAPLPSKRPRIDRAPGL
jgi:hypothetical protein